MPLAAIEPIDAQHCRRPPARVGHLGHGLGGKLVLALTLGHSPFWSARSTASRTSLDSSYFGFLDQTVLISRQKTSSGGVYEKYARTPPAVYTGYGRRQECSSGPVLPVSSVKRQRQATGVLDQNLDQASDGIWQPSPARVGPIQQEDCQSGPRGSIPERVLCRALTARARRLSSAAA